MRLRAVPQPGPPRPLDDILYQVQFDSIGVQLDRTREEHAGTVAGMEGIGCQIFGDEQGLVYAADLELLPFEAVDVPPPEIVEAAVAAVRARRRPGHLHIVQTTLIALNPRKIWLAAPFGSAVVLAFDPALAIDPPARFAEMARDLELVEAAQGLTAGLARGDGLLSLIMLEDFARRQRIGDEIVDAASDAPLAEAMKALTLAYLRDPEPAFFVSAGDDVRARYAAGRSTDARGRALLESLQAIYLDSLRRWSAD